MYNFAVYHQWFLLFLQISKASFEKFQFGINKESGTAASATAAVTAAQPASPGGNTNATPNSPDVGLAAANNSTANLAALLQQASAGIGSGGAATTGGTARED